MKYFRSYPWGLQILLFFLMTFTFLSCAGFVLFSVCTKMTGYTPFQITSINIHSPQRLINTSLVIQGIESVFVFLLPAGIFAYLTHPRPSQYLGLRAPGKKIQLLLAALVMLGASPLLILIENLVGLINFGASIKASQLANENMMSAYMKMPGFTEFLRAFIVMAVVPAFGEEMFFRGVLMRFAKKRSHTMAIPMIFTAIVFAYAHTNIYGFLSIFIAGILLAVIYNLTGSLWCSILAHLSFNGFQIILSYIGNSNATIKTYLESNSVPLYLVGAGAVIFGISFYLLLKNKTPLLANWSDDYTLEELIDLGDELRK